MKSQHLVPNSAKLWLMQLTSIRLKTLVNIGMCVSTWMNSNMRIYVLKIYIEMIKNQNKTGKQKFFSLEVWFFNFNLLNIFFVFCTSAFEHQIFNQFSCSLPDFLSNISFEKPLFFSFKKKENKTKKKTNQPTNKKAVDLAEL